MLDHERGLLDERGGGRAIGADPARVAGDLDEPAEQPEHGADGEHHRERAQRGERGPARRRDPERERQRRGRPDQPADGTPQQAERERVAGRGRDARRLGLTAERREDQHQQPERQRDQHRPPRPSERRRALGAMELPASRQRQRDERDREQQSGMDAARAQPRVDHRREQRAHGLAKGFRGEARFDADGADDRVLRRDHRDQEARGEDDARRHRSGDRRGDDPWHGEAVAQHIRERRRFGTGGVSGGGGGSARRWRPTQAAGGSAGGGSAGSPADHRPPLDSTSNSACRAPQDEQKRARALMRSPQLGQKRVSGCVIVGGHRILARR